MAACSRAAVVWKEGGGEREITASPVSCGRTVRVSAPSPPGAKVRTAGAGRATLGSELAVGTCTAGIPGRKLRAAPFDESGESTNTAAERVRSGESVVRVI